MVTGDPVVLGRVLRRVLRTASDWPFDQSPPEMGREIHRIIREETGDPDPYREVKERFNRFALGLLPGLRARVAASADPFATAVRLAVAGNIIDFALTGNLGEDVVTETIEDTLTRPLAVDHLEALRRAAGEAAGILYLGDNAGEIVLDRLLLEQLPRGKVTFVVRGAPVINDATLVDAEAAGLGEIATVVDNGADVPGTVLRVCSDDFRARFRRADLVISKGQGNYETLTDAGRPVFHLLKVKCPVVAADIGCEVGGVVVKLRSGDGEACSGGDT
jgi:uncharacterized protein with ATP-grasp and redox domains